MPKFNVQVTVKVERTYTVQIDASTESRAEDQAAGRWRTETGDDFQVDKVDSWEFETDQLTAECPECGVEHPISTWDTPTCHCAAIGIDKTSRLAHTGEPHNIPHLVVDGVCTPAPWWYQDQDVCAACGAAIEAKEEVSNGRP